MAALSDETIELIKHHNALDLELYSYADRLLTEGTLGEGAEFLSELRQLNTENSRHIAAYGEYAT